MKIFKSVSEFTQFRKSLTNMKIGFIPTMGNLHQGHLSLVKSSLSQTKLTIVSIFVNPLQFGENEDFGEYPRTLDKDLEKLKSLDKNNIVVFAPSSAQEIYPENFSSKILTMGMDDKLCGTTRPGHFEGVTTIVFILFQLVRPHLAFFGMKDFQQLSIIKKMVKDLYLNVEIVAHPIIREESGLALSSRNQYLSNTERELALNLLESLKLKKELILKDKNYLLDQSLPKLPKECRWDYLNIVSQNTLRPATLTDKKILIAGAMFVGTTRLIDNLTLDLTC